MPYLNSKGKCINQQQQLDCFSLEQNNSTKLQHSLTYRGKTNLSEAAIQLRGIGPTRREEKENDQRIHWKGQSCAKRCINTDDMLVANAICEQDRRQKDKAKGQQVLSVTWHWLGGLFGEESGRRLHLQTLHAHLAGGAFSSPEATWHSELEAGFNWSFTLTKRDETTNILD